jgi:hypothetical protein
MKLSRFLCRFALLFATLMVGLSAAQPSSVVANQPNRAREGQRSLVQADAQPVPAAGKSQIKFATGVAYDSAGIIADSVAVADLNGQGVMDAVALDYCLALGQGACDTPGELGVLLGNGDGTFQSPVSYSTGAYWANSVAVGDVNGDGIADLVVANSCQSLGPYLDCTGYGTVSVMLGNGDGTFLPAATYSTGAYNAYEVAIRDVNGDQMPDLVVANLYQDQSQQTGSATVLLGNGDGTFQPAVNYSSGGHEADSLAIGDFNGDGIPDLAVASYCEQGHNCEPGYIEGQVGVLRGNGDGTFQPVVTYDSGGAYAHTVAVADLRGNGVLDLIVANEFDGKGDSNRDAVGVLLGNGDGTFQPAVTYFSGGSLIDSVAVGDVNGDSLPDLVVVGECQKIGIRIGCGGTGTVSVMLGNGDGTFQAPVTYSSGGYEGSAIAIGDVNGDGRPDLVVTNACGSNESNCGGSDGTVAVLLNETSYKTKTTLSASPNPAHVNQTVALTATITSTPYAPDGEVATFFNGKTSLGTGTTENGMASLTTSFAAAKTYTIKANYPGDAFRKKSSGTLKLVVNP